MFHKLNYYCILQIFSNLTLKEKLNLRLLNKTYNNFVLNNLIQIKIKHIDNEFILKFKKLKKN